MVGPIRDKLYDSLELLIDNSKIDRVSNFKYLGIIFDQHLNMNCHVD